MNSSRTPCFWRQAARAGLTKLAFPQLIKPANARAEGVSLRSLIQNKVNTSLAVSDRCPIHACNLVLSNARLIQEVARMKFPSFDHRSGSDFVVPILEAECRAPIRPLTIRESPWEY